MKRKEKERDKLLNFFSSFCTGFAGANTFEDLTKV